MGVSVKDVVPTVTSCPLCNQDGLAIYLDPISGGHNRWLRCPKCGFAGDVADLLERVYDVDDLRAALRMAVDRGHCTAPDTEKDAEEIYNVLITARKSRRAAADAWEWLRAGCDKDISQEVLALLRRENLWPGLKTSAMKRYFQYLGGGTKTYVNKILPELSASGPVLLPAIGFSAAMALSYQDVPGRICAVEFFGPSGERFLKTVGREETAEGGLAMLDALEPFENSVLASGDPKLALHLQRLQAIDDDSPVKVVAYNDRTAKAWTSVSVRRVYFHTRVVDRWLFEHVRRVGCGLIASEPRIRGDGDLTDVIRKYSLPEIMAEIEGSARDWRAFLVEWATDPANGNAAPQLVARLNLCARERKEVLSPEHCPLHRRPMMEQLLGEVYAVQSFITNGAVVVENRDGWYADHKTGLELISDAVIHPKQEIVDADTGEVEWRGEVIFRGTAVPFQAPVSQIEINPVRWLSQLLANAGLGAPHVHPRWPSFMTYMARCSSAISAVSKSVQPGLQADGSLEFPRFRIAGGKVSPKDGPPPDAGRPAAVIPVPARRARDARDEPSPERKAWLGLSLAYLHNLLAPALKSTAAPIAAVGSEGSVVAYTVSAFAEAIGPKVVEFAAGHRPIQIATKADYRYTILLRYSPHDHNHHRYKLRQGENALLMASPVEAHALGTELPCLYVEVAGQSKGRVRLPPVDDLMLYAQELQSRDYSLPEDKAPLTALALDFCHWYAYYLKLPPAKLLEELKGAVRVSPPAGDCMVRLVNVLIRVGKMRIRHEPILTRMKNGDTPTGRLTSLFVDDAEGLVYVPIPGLAYAMHVCGHPFVSPFRVTEDLADRGLLRHSDLCPEGWMVEKTYWDRACSGA